MKKILIIAALNLALAVVSHAQVKSVYTGLTEKACKTLKSFPEEDGSYVGECPGVGAYKLELIEGDLRQSINVVSPGGRKTELNLWNISGGFSSLGPRAEWRVNGKRPEALIVRFNVSEDPENSSKITSYLVVIKLADTVCITAALKPTRSQNAEARRAAGRSAERPCRFQQ